MRVLAGVGAWLIGVGAATAGSLLAVSLLGQGIATGTSQQLTADAVNRALAAEADETHGSGSVTAGSPSPMPSATPSDRVRPYLSPQTAATPLAWPSTSRPAPAPSAQPIATAAPTSTVLTSPGGTAVAECRTAGAYLVSWSPATGYEAGAVSRGPAATARVTFDSDANSVTMRVSCPAGAPTASSTVGGSGSGGDDGGGGGDD
jgi:hypothetical protein